MEEKGEKAEMEKGGGLVISTNLSGNPKSSGGSTWELWSEKQEATNAALGPINSPLPTSLSRIISPANIALPLA